MTAKKMATASDYSPVVLNELSKLAMISIELIGFRFRRSGMGILLAIGEPVAVVIMFSFLQEMIIRRPPFGTSLPLFFASGIIPFYLFFHTTLRFRLWDVIPRYPQVSEVEMLVGQLVSELVSKFIIISICCGGLYWYGVDEAIPAHPLVCLEALLLLLVLGAAGGFVNVVIASVFPAWTYIYQVGLRGWMAFSGVLFVVDYMPKPIREAAVWIPITHAITLYRSGQYLRYPQMTLDMSYLLGCTVGAVAFAIVLENGTRRWRNFR